MQQVGPQQLELVHGRAGGRGDHVGWPGERGGWDDIGRADRVNAVGVPVEVSGSLDGRTVGPHPVARRVGVDARDVEENDRGEDAEDRDDDEQFHEGESTLVAVRALARIFEYGEDHCCRSTSLGFVERRAVILRDL